MDRTTTKYLVVGSTLLVMATYILLAIETKGGLLESRTGIIGIVVIAGLCALCAIFTGDKKNKS